MNHQRNSTFFPKGGVSAFAPLQATKPDDDESERNARRLRPTASKEGQ
jgi:hypothetical protein